MNDRFRFRAWDKQDKELIYEAENTYDCQSYNGHTIWHDNFACLLDDKERYTVEQCTGLKDKNGRLIYENDFVKITGDVMTMPLKYLDCLFKVIWADIGFCFETINENDGLGFCDCFEYEVIGNIHENPELLESKQCL